MYRPTKRIAKDTPTTFNELSKQQIENAKKTKGKNWKSHKVQNLMKKTVIVFHVFKFLPVFAFVSSDEHLFLHALDNKGLYILF